MAKSKAKKIEKECLPSYIAATIRHNIGKLKDPDNITTRLHEGRKIFREMIPKIDRTCGNLGMLHNHYASLECGVYNHNLKNFWEEEEIKDYYQVLKFVPFYKKVPIEKCKIWVRDKKIFDDTVVAIDNSNINKIIRYGTTATFGTIGVTAGYLLEPSIILPIVGAIVFGIPINEILYDRLKEEDPFNSRIKKIKTSAENISKVLNFNITSNLIKIIENKKEVE